MTVLGITSTYAADALRQADTVIGKLGQIRVTSNGTSKLGVEILSGILPTGDGVIRSS
jgi:hypothetical protein